MRIKRILDNGWAEREAGGIVKKASILLLDNCLVGDYVLNHAGYAIAKVDENASRKMISQIKQPES